MRNWNYVSVYTIAVINLSLDRTYEELKQFSSSVRHDLSSKVWIVPMRNWNKKSRWTCLTSTAVWIVPMRNWNNIDPVFPKPLPYFVWIVPMRNWNREWVTRPRGSSWKVWIVPMRNWNQIHASQPCSRNIGFGSYLWGIETIRICFYFPPVFLFGSYLWGIETWYWAYIQSA